MSETAVTSFIIRFTQEKEVDTPDMNWHGLVRHVQSSEECHFAKIEEALTFISNFVEIGNYAEM